MALQEVIMALQEVIMALQEVIIYLQEEIMTTIYAIMTTFFEQKSHILGNIQNKVGLYYFFKVNGFTVESTEIKISKTIERLYPNLSILDNI